VLFRSGATAPAPSGGNGFSFGNASTPAPASGAFGFGSPAPTPGGFGFGTAAPSAFGAKPMFGSSPAPTGGFFGNPSGPASGGFGLGSPSLNQGGGMSGAPAPSAFGYTPPSGSFGIPSNSGAPVAPEISSQTSYSDLNAAAKQAIDAIHEQILRHRRSMMQVECMGPALLRDVKPGDVAAGMTLPLKDQLVNLNNNIMQLNDQVSECGNEAVSLKRQFEGSTTQSVMYGVWPIEALAARRGVKLSTVDATKTDPTVQEQLRKQLDLQTAYVDRIEKIPSPYMWQQLADMERRSTELTHMIQSLKQQLDMSRKINDVGIASVVQNQTEFLQRVYFELIQVHGSMEGLRAKYNQWERGPNVLDEARIEEEVQRRRIEEQVKIDYIKAAHTQNSTAPTPGAPSPAPNGLFGDKPSTGLFGSTPAPTPVGGSLFGNTQAANPVSGSLFANTPAPTPAGGSLFGNAPAPTPAGGSLFGNAPATNPVGGSLFGNTPAPTTAGGGLFGNTPAPAAPAPGGLFGSTPAPASTGLFGTASTGGVPAPPTFGAPPAFGSTPDTGAFGLSGGFGSSTAKAKKTSTSSSRRRK